MLLRQDVKAEDKGFNDNTGISTDTDNSCANCTVMLRRKRHKLVVSYNFV